MNVVKVMLQPLDGVLFFPVTPFHPETGAVARDALVEHLERGLAWEPGAVFVACGTGEFHALAPDEFEVVVRTAVEVVGGRVPVFAGTGGPLPVAQDLARRAEAVGADGLLLLPPYLAKGPSRGIVEYVRRVTCATELPLIVYNRDNAMYDEEAAVEVSQFDSVVGFKDGVGDLDQLSRVVRGVRGALKGTKDGFQFFNGMPTAEVTVQAYRGMGVDLWSSAVFCFAPEISKAFYAAVTSGDDELVGTLLRDFFHPLVRLRDRVPGYAVSLVKAAVTLSGVEAGSVRPPLVDPSPAHLAELQAVLERGRELVAPRLEAAL